MVDISAYLRRLKVDREPPGVEALRTLHAAHVEQIAYEALDVQLGLVNSIQPADSVARITRNGRGGYCYHLNGAFSVLLKELGYDVGWHRAGVQGRDEAEPPGPRRANHLALTVRGLPTKECPDGEWLVDTGLGDALHEPLPLVEGEYVQGPLTFGLRHSEVTPGGWRLDHDERGSFRGMDFEKAEATVAHFQERHVVLSTSPDSGFVRTCAVHRRDAKGVDSLTGCVLKRVDAEPEAPRTIESEKEWFEALHDVFGLELLDLDDKARTRLWAKVAAAHEAWQRR